MGQPLLTDDIAVSRSSSIHALVNGLHSRSLLYKVIAIGSCILFGSTNLFAFGGSEVMASEGEMDIVYANDFTVPETGFFANVAIVTPSPEAQAQVQIAAVETPAPKAEVAPKKAPAPAKPKNQRVATTAKVAAPKAAILKSEEGNGQCGGLSWPVAAKTRLSRGFAGGHIGLDISYADSSNMYLPIVAADDGEVVESSLGWNGGYGNVIVIDHGNGYMTRYGHNSKLLVKVGDKVKKGQKIAIMGATGRVFGRTGIHLHFEVIKAGRRINPAKCF